MELEKYPVLFHKYLLGIANSDSSLPYTVRQKYTIDSSKYLCHLHIYDLNYFDTIFGTYLYVLLDSFNILVSYCKGSEIFKEGITYLHVKNKGYDIGGKICVLDYLEEYKIDYSYILFLHSKKDKIKRGKYFRPLIMNLKWIIEELHEKDGKLLGIFPNTLWIDENGIKNYRNGYDVFKENIHYINNFLEYNQCSNRYKLFSEGNCMILHKKVLDYIFLNKTKLYYNILNEDNSFDYNWFISYYRKKHILGIKNCYEEYQKNQLYGNNNPLRDLRRQSHPDAMIEHLFERIWINIIIHLGGDYLVINELGQSSLNMYLEHIKQIKK